MFLFILNLITAVIIAVRVLQSKLSASRGTNALMRTLRDTVSMSQYKIALMVSVVTSILTLLIGLLFKCGWACIPTTLVIIMIIVFQFKQNNSEQRVKDSRVVTKGSLKVAGATAEAAGTVIGTAVAGPAGAASGQQIGKVAGSLSNDFADSMKDVDAPDIKKIEITDPKEFIEACSNAGIPTDGVDLSDIARRVIKCAPPLALAEFEGLPDDRKAIAIMCSK